MIKVIDRSENQIYDNNKHLIDKFAEFSSENLGFDKPVSVYFSDDHENAQDPLGKTAHYDPNKMEIHILVTGRHLKDILRSISHELIHHVQNCNGDLDDLEDTSAGYAQRDDHTRGMEHRAYTAGNIMNFRDFEDKFKSEKSTMNENHFKKNRLKALHALLMERSKYSAAISGLGPDEVDAGDVASDMAAALAKGVRHRKAAVAGAGATGAGLAVAGRGAPHKGPIPNKPFSAPQVEEIALLFYQALEGFGTDEEKLQKAVDSLNQTGPKFTKAVEAFFDKKYGPGTKIDWDTLRGGLDGDLSGDEQEVAMAPFVLADKVAADAVKAEKAAAAARKCPNYPITPGCEGDNVANIIAILIRGTEYGEKAIASNEKEIEEMYKKSAYTPAVQQFIHGAVASIDANVAKDFTSKKGVIERGGLTANLINKLAGEKGIKENKKAADLKNKRLFELNARMMKRII